MPASGTKGLGLSFMLIIPTEKVKYEQLLSTYNTESYDSVYPLVLPSASPSARTRVST